MVKKVPLLTVAEDLFTKYISWRKYNRELKSFLAKDTVMIRWDVPIHMKSGGESSAGILVKKEVVQDLVEKHYHTLMSECGLYDINVEIEDA